LITNFIRENRTFNAIKHHIPDKELQLDFNIIDGPFDIVIGRPDLIRHSLIPYLIYSTREHTPTKDQVLLGLLCDKVDLLSLEKDDDYLEDFWEPHDVLAYDAIPAEIEEIKIEGTIFLKEELWKLCREYSDIFSSSVRALPADVPPMEIKVNDDQWFRSQNRQPPRPQSKIKREEAFKQTNHMLELGVIRPSQANAFSQILLVPKPNGKWRFCVDWRALNDCSESMSWPIPIISNLLNRIGSKKPNLFSKMDMTSGYHQTPLHEESKKYTAFMTAWGLFEYNRVGMGLKGACSYFQQMLAFHVLHGYMYDFCESYIDDIITFSDNEKGYLEDLRKVFQRFREKRITLNPAKCQFGLSEIEFVGHIINKDGINFSKEKVLRVLDFPKPKTVKELQTFVGMCDNED